MKTRLHAVAALVCLLMVFSGSMSCIHLAMAIPMQAAAGHCPMHVPQSHNVPACCRATHQPPAAITTAQLEQPVLFSTTLAPFLPNPVAPRLSPRTPPPEAPPPLPPHIPLRI